MFYKEKNFEYYLKRYIYKYTFQEEKISKKYLLKKKKNSIPDHLNIELILTKNKILKV